MNEIKGIRMLPEALAEIVAGTERLATLKSEHQRLSDQIDGEITQLQEISQRVKQFLDGEPTVPQPASNTGRSLIIAGKLPKDQPRQAYERVKAIIIAAADPEGINFSGITSAYQSLRWRDWDNEHLDTKLRDAIKNLRKLEKDNLTHTGEKRGKYKIINP